MAFVRYDFPAKNTLNTLLLMPIMIPEVVLGVALLLFIRWLQQPKSFLLLLIGHVVLTLPYVLLVIQARLVGIKIEYEEAAQSLGANALQTFKEVTLPLLAPAILAGMLFSFTISFDDVTATLFWATASNADRSGENIRHAAKQHQPRNQRPGNCNDHADDFDPPAGRVLGTQIYQGAGIVEELMFTIEAVVWSPSASPARTDAN